MADAEMNDVLCGVRRMLAPAGEDARPDMQQFRAMLREHDAKARKLERIAILATILLAIPAGAMMGPTLALLVMHR
jgi:hypothetical protein